METTLSPAERNAILTRIQSLHQAGEPMNLSAVKRRHPDLLARVFAVRPFWGWKQALADAGIDYGQIRVELGETVRCELCGREMDFLGTHLPVRHGLTPAEYLARFPGADLSSDTRLAKQRREGTSPTLPHWEPFYTREYLLDRIAAYHRAGYPIGRGQLARFDIALTHRSYRMGIDWNELLTELGFGDDLPNQQSLTPGQVVQRLKELAGATRRAPALVQLRMTEPVLAAAILHHFGKFSKALRAAGVKSDRGGRQRSRHPGRDEVLVLARAFITGPGDGEIDSSSLERHDPALYKAILHHFGALAGLRRELGLPGNRSRRKSMGLAHPDLATAVAAIQARAAAGLPMFLRVLETGPTSDRKLFHSIGRFFDGSIAAACEVAGVPIPSGIPLERLARATVLRRLHALHAAGCLSNHEQTRTSGREGAALVASAVRHFGSWGRAVAAAGLDLRRQPHLRTREPGRASAALMTRDEIKAALRERFLPGEYQFAAKLGAEGATGRRLGRHAVAVFGSLRAAAAAAGLAPAPATAPAAKRKPQTRPTPPPAPMGPGEVLEALRARHAAGLPLVLARMRESREGAALWRQIRTHFSNLGRALEAAGLPPPRGQPRETAPAEQLLDSLRGRAAAGQPIAATALQHGTTADRALARDLIRCFGSIGRAREAAGLPAPARGPRASASLPADEALKQLRERQTAGLPYSAGDLRGGSSDEQRLIKSLVTRFGGFRKALAAAGLPPPTRTRSSLLPAHPYHGRDELLAALRSRHAQGLLVTTPALARDGLESRKLLSSIRHHFASLAAACDAAAIPRPSTRRHRNDDGKEFPTAESVLAGLRQRHAAGQRLGTTDLLRGSPEDRRLYLAIKTFFPGIREARDAAGLPKHRRKPKENPLWLLRKMAEAGVIPWDESLAVKKYGPRKPKAPKNRAAPPPGPGTRQPRAKRGTNDPWVPTSVPDQLIPGLDLENTEQVGVILALQERFKAGKPMRYQALRFGPLAHRDPELYRSAVRLFGSWHNALKVAGIQA
jgi:hypothetical protein